MELARVRLANRVIYAEELEHLKRIRLKFNDERNTVFCMLDNLKSRARRIERGIDVFSNSLTEQAVADEISAGRFLLSGLNRSIQAIDDRCGFLLEQPIVSVEDCNSVSE